MSRRMYCSKHLEEFRKTLGDNVKEQRISEEKFLFCSYPGCTMAAQYDMKIEQKRGVILS